MPSSTTARKTATTSTSQIPRQRSSRPGTQRKRGQQGNRAGTARQQAAATSTTAQGDSNLISGLTDPSSWPRLRMPGGTAGRALWWGGLATVAAFGVVDWPVAALVAAGTWVAEQQARQSGPARRAG